MRAGFKILAGLKKPQVDYKERIENSIKRQEKYIKIHEELIQINLSENNFSIASRRMKSILVAQEKIKLLRGILSD